MIFSCWFPISKSLVRGLIVLSLAVPCFGGAERPAVQTPVVNSPTRQATSAGTQPATAATATAPPRMRGTTMAQRKAAAAHVAARRAASLAASPAAKLAVPRALSLGVHSNAIVGTPGE